METPGKSTPSGGNSEMINAGTPSSISGLSSPSLSMMNSGNNIKVVCRFRPLNEMELAQAGDQIIQFEDNYAVAINHSKGRHQFAFDRVFDWNSKQDEVFEYAAKPVVQDLMQGFNGTIFAYGQTGSGKTFTMQGPDVDNPGLKGLIPRIVDNIFSEIMNAPSYIEFLVQVSYLEIYMEKIRDLLDPRQDNLHIHEDKNKGVYVKDLREIYVSSPQETLDIMKLGASNRAVSSTNMNEQSSRSHSLFSIRVKQTNKQNQSERSGTLYLVDLAGSEMVSKTGAAGQTLEEAKKINRSLTALGMVINSLTDGKSTHIPYRDSKLTRILQESLGGNARTTLIINCSPAVYNEMETLSTLRFGMRAKKIQNRAKINLELSKTELQRLLNAAKLEIVALRQVIHFLNQELSTWRSGGNVPESKRTNSEELLQKLLSGDIQPMGDTAKDTDRTQPATSSGARSIGDEVFEFASPVTKKIMDEDEKNEILRHEDELTTQLEEKEAEIQKLLEINSLLIEEKNKLEMDNKETFAKVNEYSLLIDKLQYDREEINIFVENLQSKVDSLTAKLAEVEAAEKVEIEPEINHNQVMENMLKEVQLRDQNLTTTENQIKEVLELIGSRHGESEYLKQQFELDQKEKKDLLEIQKSNIESLAKAELTIREYETELSSLRLKVEHLSSENEILKQSESKWENLHSRLENDLLGKIDAALQNNDIEGRDEMLTSIKAVLEDKMKDEVMESKINELQAKLSQQVDVANNYERLLKEERERVESVTNAQLQMNLRCSELESQIELLKQADSTVFSEKEKEINLLKDLMTKQSSEFNEMKELMKKEMKNYCQKVVELQVENHDLKEHLQEFTGKTDTSKSKKMRNFEAKVKEVEISQRNLLELVAKLKADLATAQKQIIAKDMRINALEQKLAELSDRLKSSEQSRSFLGESSDKSKYQYQKVETRIAKPITGGGGGSGMLSKSYAANTPTKFTNASISTTDLTSSARRKESGTPASPTTNQQNSSNKSKGLFGMVTSLFN